jgi:tRNA-splicing ligase RtcB
MAISTLKGDVVPIKLWTKVENVESEALTQLKQVAALPWVFKHVAVMPDCHYGKGATVGSVIAMKGALSPAACGVDIGCGMGAIRTNLKASDLPENLSRLRQDIEAAIPVGFASHEHGMFDRMNNETLRMEGRNLFEHFSGLDERVHVLEGRARRQAGTLGGGNHFIELCLDEGRLEPCDPDQHERWIGHKGTCPECKDTGSVVVEPRVWMMLHSGSRNIGKELAEIHIAKARELSHNENLPNRDLAVFLAGTPEMKAYRNDLLWAQRYAFLNRKVMFQLYKRVMLEHFPNVRFEDQILCHHNYVSEETHFGEDLIVTRKGAISAKAGELGIIPGSMGTKSYIVEGLGNEESFTSASHGAGRRMSRGKAKKSFTLDDLAAQTAGVECRKDVAVLDEIPGAYKNIDQVMANQADLVKVKAVLKQVLCVKG